VGRTTTPAKPKGERGSERPSVAVLVTLVGAMLAAVISGTNLTFELWPGLKPDPKEKTAGELEVLEIDKNVYYREYDARPGRNVVENLGLEESGKNYPGNVFYLRAHIEGFKRGTLRLIWFTYDSNRHRRRMRHEARSDRIFEPDSPINTQVAQVWVKEPGYFEQEKWKSEPDEYFVRFELYSGHMLLAFKDSPTFKTS
jgi:hypothetical protein